MRCRDINEAQWEDIVAKVSREAYGCNLIPHPNAASYRLSVISSREPGARRSHSGRRLAVACWHTWRDVLAELFERYPDATVRTALATYVGRGGFEDWFPITGAANIGSIMEPMRIDEACDCASPAVRVPAGMEDR
jgi:hypothetical protein